LLLLYGIMWILTLVVVQLSVRIIVRSAANFIPFPISNPLRLVISLIVIFLLALVGFFTWIVPALANVSLTFAQRSFTGVLKSLLLFVGLGMILYLLRKLSVWDEERQELEAAKETGREAGIEAAERKAERKAEAEAQYE